jgi:hypothetical protein
MSCPGSAGPSSDVDDVRLVVDDEHAVLLGAGGGGVHTDIVGVKAGKLLRAA